jgi:hypothetical protein
MKRFYLLLTLIVNSSPAQTGEFLIDTSIVYVAAGSIQEEPIGAFDGTNYLVVWVDFRSIDSEIYCTRIDQSGNVLDPWGIQVTDDNFYQKEPDVVFDGINFLIVWRDNRTDGGDIYGARVTPSGTVIEVNGFLISGAANLQREPDLASDGTTSFVVWMDDRTTAPYSDIYGARVSQGGTVLDPNGILISDASLNQQIPSVSFDGTNYIVVWQDYRSGVDIYGARVSQAAVVLDPAGIPISTASGSQNAPTVAFNGVNYLVAWQDSRNGGILDIYGARVNTSGIVLDASGVAISSAADDQVKPSVASDGINFLITWTDGRNFRNDIYGARVDNSGNVLEPNGIAITTAEEHQENPAAVFGGLNYLVVWDDKRLSFFNDIFGARIQPSGIVLDTNAFLLSLGTNYQNYPSAAYDGSNYLVVWEDFRNNSLDIYGARVTPSGVVLDSQPIPIGLEINDQSHPAVIFDGTNFFVVWQDERNDPYYTDIYGTLLSPDGTVLNPNGIVISNAADNQVTPKLAFDGVNYLAVWADYRNDAFNPDIYGARISQSGVLLDPNGIAIQTVFDEDEEAPSVAFDGTNFMVVWEDQRNTGGEDIYGARVDQNGLVLDPNGIAISSHSGSQTVPVIVFGDTNYLVLWEDRRSGEADIYGAVIDPAGTIQDTTLVSNASGTQSGVSLVNEGSDYLAVWGDNFDPGGSDIFGAHISSTGEVLDSFSVVTKPGIQQYPTLAHGTGSISLLVYRGWTDNYNSKTYNAMRIWGKYIDTSTGIEIDESYMVSRFRLFQNYPNPFNPTTTIRYTIPNVGTLRATSVQLKVYDVLGNEVATLVNEEKPAGTYEVDFNTSSIKHHTSSGVYFYQLKAGNYLETKKIILIK